MVEVCDCRILTQQNLTAASILVTTGAVNRATFCACKYRFQLRIPTYDWPQAWRMLGTSLEFTRNTRAPIFRRSPCKILFCSVSLITWITPTFCGIVLSFHGKICGTCIFLFWFCSMLHHGKFSHFPLKPLAKMTVPPQTIITKTKQN